MKENFRNENKIRFKKKIIQQSQIKPGKSSTWFTFLWCEILTSTMLLYEHREQGLKFGVFLDLIKTAGPPWTSLERPEKEDKSGDGKAEIKLDRLHVGSPCVCAFPLLKRVGENL